MTLRKHLILRRLRSTRLAGRKAPILKEQVWPVMLFGNLFAAVAMTGYFRQRHPRLTIHP